MTTILITSGAHWRNTHLPPLSESRQFAHRFDPDEAEDVAHQAHNFTTYAKALGSYDSPFVLISPSQTDDPVEQQHVEVELSDWVSIVSTATGVRVETR